MSLLFKLLGAKTRNEIQRGKLWEITRLWGIDVCKSEKEVAKPVPRKKMEGGDMEAQRTHSLKPLDNVANMTKKADLL